MLLIQESATALILIMMIFVAILFAIKPSPAFIKTSWSKLPTKFVELNKIYYKISV